MKPLEKAIACIKGAKYRTTIHSDQGWHYQHAKWVRTLQKHRIFQSMSRKGNCLDNSPMENFFGLLKQEMYHGVKYETYEQLKAAIEDYMKYYNNKRIKQKLAGMSPVQYRIHSNQHAA
jgi:putative transposase